MSKILKFLEIGMMTLIGIGLFEGYPLHKELSAENIIRDVVILICFITRILVWFAARRSSKWANRQVKVLNLLTLVYLFFTFRQVYFLFNWVVYANMHHYIIHILIIWSPLIFWTFEAIILKRNGRRRKAATLL